jgi:hypothetical protein
MKMFEDRVLRRIFGGIIKGGRKLHEKPHYQKN